MLAASNCPDGQTPDAALAGRRPTRASRSGTSGRSGARSKRCSSRPWRGDPPDADLRPGLSALEGSSPATPGGGWPSPATASARDLQNRLAQIAPRCSPGCRPWPWSSSWPSGACSSSKSASVLSRSSFLISACPDDGPDGPKAYRADGLDHRLRRTSSWPSTFCRMFLVLARRARASSARTCGSTPCRCTSRGRSRRIDYFLGKLGVIGFFLAAVAGRAAVGRLRARRRLQPRPRASSATPTGCCWASIGYGWSSRCRPGTLDAGPVVAVAELAATSA